MMEKYEELDMEVIIFEGQDVIRTSVGDDDMGQPLT